MYGSWARSPSRSNGPHVNCVCLCVRSGARESKGTEGGWLWLWAVPTTNRWAHCWGSSCEGSRGSCFRHVKFGSPLGHLHEIPRRQLVRVRERLRQSVNLSSADLLAILKAKGTWHGFRREERESKRGPRPKPWNTIQRKRSRQKEEKKKESNQGDREPSERDVQEPEGSVSTTKCVLLCHLPPRGHVKEGVIAGKVLLELATCRSQWPGQEQVQWKSREGNLTGGTSRCWNRPEMIFHRCIVWRAQRHGTAARGGNGVGRLRVFKTHSDKNLETM